LAKLAPGASVDYVETWEIYDSLDQPFIPDTLLQRLDEI